MSRQISQFKFKQFSVSHHRSSMKVGVDGVLIGCWTEVENVQSILDVGSGCGLISLIMAQRCPRARVTGIEIDRDSIDEAIENIENSEWSDRMEMIHGSFPEGLNAGQNNLYDLIVSNPPYFNSGVSDIVTSRERARHQGSLSPSTLLYESRRLLVPNGMLSMVVPSEMSFDLEEEAKEIGYSLMKKCLVRGHEGKPYKRALLQWSYPSGSRPDSGGITEFLTLESSPNQPTESYRQLCKDFYLKF